MDYKRGKLDPSCQELLLISSILARSVAKMPRLVLLVRLLLLSSVTFIVNLTSVGYQKCPVPSNTVPILTMTKTSKIRLLKRC